MTEVTSAQVGAIAARGLKDPMSITPDEVLALCGSALTQRPDHAKPAPEPVVTTERVRSLHHQAALVIRSLLRDSRLADHVVAPYNEKPIVASNLITQLEAEPE